MVRGVRKALGRRHGRLSVQFEEPVSLRRFAERRLGPGAASLTLDDVMPDVDASAAASSPDQHKRQLVQGLANPVAYGISRAVTVMPAGLVASALLAHVRRGVVADVVAQRVELLRIVAAEDGARFSPGLPGAPSDPRLPGPIAAAVVRFMEDGLVRVTSAAGETIYEVVEEKRPLLDYHRNTVIHRYVGLALVASAVRGAAGERRQEDVKARARELSRLLKLEFMYRVGVTFDEIFAENVAFLVRVGALEIGDGAVRAGASRDALEFLADLVRPWLEAYLVAAEALLALDRAGGGLERKNLVRSVLEHGRAAYAAGRIAQRESVSKATFENAAAWFSQEGALEPAEGGRVRLRASWRDERLPQLVTTLRQALSAPMA